MTMREFLTKVIELGDVELQEFAQKEINKLDAKNEKRKTTLSKDQKANEELKIKILNLLANGDFKASEIGIELEISTSKASALLQQLVKSGDVISTDVKSGKSKVKQYKLAN